MELRCPNCGTRFRVDAELLREQGSVVRCSMCNTRFRAFPDPDRPPELIERGEPQPQPEPAEEAPEEAEPSATDTEETDGFADELAAAESDDSVPAEEEEPQAGSEETGAPEPEAGEEAVEEDEGDEAEEAEETPRERKRREKAEAKAQKAQEKEQKRQAKAERKAAKKAAKGGWGRFFLRLLLVVLILALLAELAYVFRVRILGYAMPRQLTEQALERLELDWQLPVAVTRYHVEGLAAQRMELPSGKQVTVLRGELVNSAAFAQRPPRMAVRALGAGERVLYRQTLTPGRPFRAEAAGEQGETTLDRASRHAREQFPRRFEPQGSQAFQLVLDGVPPGVRRFRLEMVN